MQSSFNPRHSPDGTVVVGAFDAVDAKAAASSSSFFWSCSIPGRRRGGKRGHRSASASFCCIAANVPNRLSLPHRS